MGTDSSTQILSVLGYSGCNKLTTLVLAKVVEIVVIYVQVHTLTLHISRE